MPSLITIASFIVTFSIIFSTSLIGYLFAWIVTGWTLTNVPKKNHKKLSRTIILINLAAFILEFTLVAIASSIFGENPLSKSINTLTADRFWNAFVTACAMTSAIFVINTTNHHYLHLKERQ